MENPEIMAGIPMAILGAIGLLVALLLTAAPSEDGPRKPGTGRVAFAMSIALAWLTVVEYVIAVKTSHNIVALMILAVIEAALIGFFFMRVMRISAAHREEH